MIKCPNPDCGYENVDGTQFCEGCGEELPQAGASATGANAASGNAGGNTPIHGAASPATSAASGMAASGMAASGMAASGMVRCPACENMNPADNVVCEVCGTELHPRFQQPILWLRELLHRRFRWRLRVCRRAAQPFLRLRAPQLRMLRLLRFLPVWVWQWTHRLSLRRSLCRALRRAAFRRPARQCRHQTML